MFRNFLRLTIAASICTVPNIVLAQEGLPQPNKKRDYYNSNWHQWLVVDRDRKGLNCRSGSGSNYRVIKKFYNSNRIYVFTQGDDQIRFDKQGKPWLGILPNGYQYENPCFVRANNSFIQPIPRE